MTESNKSSQWDIYNMYRIDIANLIGDASKWSSYLDSINSVPRSIKDLLFSTEAIEILIVLSEDFDLSDEQSGDLTRITRDILLGDLFINDMTPMIGRKLNIDQQTAQQIRDKIVNELFAPAIEDIKKIQREKFPDRAGPGSGSTMPQPPLPPGMKNAPPINQSNVIDLRNQS